MNRWVGCGAIGLMLMGFFIRNLPWHLDDFDQAKQAFTSFEMVTDGHWWFQHTPTGRIATKPPLAGWISVALYGVTRSWDFAWRLPSLLSALALLALLWRAGGEGVAASGTAASTSATLAVCAFGLNLFAPRLATLARTDMLLTLFIFVAGYLVYEKLRTQTDWTSGERWTLFAVVLGSMLTKGPIAYAFLLPGLVALQWLMRRRGVRCDLWAGWWPWFAPLLVFGVWVGIGIWKNDEFYRQVVEREFLGRFTVGEEAVHKNQPLYFYVTHLLHKFAPWSALLLGLAFVKNVRAEVGRRPELLWLVCWAIGGLVLMSAVPSKRPDRIFPVIPPLCLLAPAMLSVISNPLRRRLANGAVAAAVVASTGYTLFNVYQSSRTHQDTLVRFGAAVRNVAQERVWRYGILGAKDEGMLLYLRQTGFVDRADELWKEGRLDGLVLTEAALKKAGNDFEPYTILLQSEPAPEKRSQYFFIIPKDAIPKS